MKEMEEFSQAQSPWKLQVTTKFLGKDVKLKGSMYVQYLLSESTSIFNSPRVFFFSPMSFQSVYGLPLEDTRVGRAEKNFYFFNHDGNTCQSNELLNLCLTV